MSALKDLISANGRKAMFTARRMVRIRRSMPHFILIGAQKSGTSSMFAYLKQHPQIVRPIFKEPYFFDRNYRRGLDWYGCNFPARGTIERLNDRRGADIFSSGPAQRGTGWCARTRPLTAGSERFVSTSHRRAYRE